MSHRRGGTPTHRSLGNARPYGLVLGLAETLNGVSPSRERLYYEENDRGELTIVLRSHSLEKQLLRARLLEIAGAIEVTRVRDSIRLTPGQRRNLVYAADGKLKFESGRHIDARPDAWDAMQEPGQLVVVRGFLLRQRVGFSFDPIEWDRAQPDRHLRDHVMGPAGGLAISAAQL